MFDVLIISGAVFLLVIIFLLFRIFRIIGVVRGKREADSNEVVSKSNKTNAVLLLLFMIAGFAWVVYYSVANFDVYNLPLASEHGASYDSMFWITMAITGFVFILTNVLLFYFAFRYRHDENKKALFYPDNSKLEIAWTLVPAVVLTLLVITGLQSWNKITSEPPQEAEVLEVMGYQFAWKARYPGQDGKLGNYNYQLIDAVNEFGLDLKDEGTFDDFVPREIHLPKGQPVVFKIRSRDVLHSVFAPHFRLKMDAVPGMSTSFWFVPTKTTEEMRRELNDPDFNYEIACAEVCGRGHFSMRMLVVVDEPEDYKKWYEEQESWLSKNPDYIEDVPENLRDRALRVTGLDREQTASIQEAESAVN